MPEFFLNIDPVGWDRVFLTGRIPGVEHFEIELNESQKRQLETFQANQDSAMQQFLLKLVDDKS